MASALVSRRVGLEQLTDAFVRRPEVVETMTRVKTLTTTERMADLPFAPADQVAVVLKSGKELKGKPVRHAKGSWQRPLSEAELEEKFLDCSSGALGANQAKALFASLLRLDALRSLRELPLAAVQVH
jgi:2-methylcitrate dehydratase PrpD